MIYQRGSIEDFDRYAAVTGDVGWNWTNMQQYAKKVRIVHAMSTSAFY
jgi:choline dehydrogenase-like flavoprotein